jgi:hypothetical protein
MIRFYWYFGYKLSWAHSITTLSPIYTIQFTVAHALGFSVTNSRLLATDLNTNTITSNYYEVFLSSLHLESHCIPPSQSVFNLTLQFANCSEVYCAGSNSLFNCLQLLCAIVFTFSLLNSNLIQVKAKVTLQMAVYSKSVRPSGKPIEAHDQSSFFFNWTLELIYFM